ncbi:hypothetical protein [Shewanella algae]|uniref:hypothetical protein n=1 Tax=Shewanella algae TaxID=38313 RepID=UPI001181CD1F|nr:hypothetical protein [Shewanella algae]TVL46724.1 hypothetical protein AYI98_14390 [Shewanella algae]
MRLFKALGFFAVVSMSTSALAIESYHVECNSCASEEQFNKVAKDEAIHGKTIFVNVINYHNYEFRKYKVTKTQKNVCDPKSREPDGEGGFIQDCKVIRTHTATKVELTNEELNALMSFATSYNDYKSVVKQYATAIPDTVVPSAYDLIGASYNHTKVVNYFKSQRDLRTFTERFIAQADHTTDLISNGIKITAPSIVFSFSDGSKAYAEVDFYDMDDNLHYKFTKVIDANGNQIDLKAQNPFPKLMDVSNLSLQSWQTLYGAFRAYGLAVVGETTKIVPRGTITITECNGGTANMCRHPQ